MAFLIAVIVFIAAILVVTGAFMLLREKEQQVAIAEKATDFTERADAEVAQEMALPKQPVARIFVRVIRYFGNLLKPQRKDEISLIQKRFQRAGLRNRNALVVFFGLKAICAIGLALGLVAIISIFRLQISFISAVALVLLFAAAGFYLPNWWLTLKTARRQDAIMRGFPDALDLLAVCVEAGMGLDAAIKRVGEEMRFSNQVVSDEFGLLSLEMRAGKERKEGLRSMADRINLEDVNSWVSLMVQTDKLGTSVSQALRVQSDTLRTKRSQKLEETAAKIPTKLIFPTIFCIFPALFVVILGPAMIRILRLFAEGLK